jgi:hypothetical protein
MNNKTIKKRISIMPFSPQKPERIHPQRNGIWSGKEIP